VSKKAFYHVGWHHIDLAWKRPRAEYIEMLEVFCLRILDALQTRPDFKFVIEQAWHYRNLSIARPDLVAKLKPYVQNGRLEFVGGLASTLETNLPAGESFVKNQQIGMKWVKDNFAVVPKTGWLMDTFGVHAQVPQILRQFGISDLMANRLGGRHFRSAFYAKGLDGTKMLVVGAEVYSAYVRPDYNSIGFYKSWEEIDRAFDRLQSMEGDGPYIVNPSSENELFISLHANDLVAKKAAANPDQLWKVATPSEYFAALRESGAELTVESADLNPEFTGCFSLRTAIRIHNREAENLLIEAEKWAALSRAPASNNSLDEAWWDIAFIQFHDVFTGSHPTSTFVHLLQLFDDIGETAKSSLAANHGRHLPATSPDPDQVTLTVFNGLPWERSDLVSVALPTGWENVARVSVGHLDLPFSVSDGRLSLIAPVPATGFQHVAVQSGNSGKSWHRHPGGLIENEFILLECDETVGIKRLVIKETGKVLMEDAGDFLIIQHDDGNFQIENPVEAEVVAAAGRIDPPVVEVSDLGQRIILTGVFPQLKWTGPDSRLDWRFELTLLKGQPWLDVNLGMDWKGERSRIRLKIVTTLDTSEGIYEIPFGTVRRKPYGITGNAKGEWPAQRFVAMQDGGHGLAVANAGTAGVEVNGGTLHTSLVRAPVAEYAGMVSDDTSSQHGHHDFRFALIPYVGHWVDAPVLPAAQSLNNPLMAEVTPGALEGEPSSGSFLAIEATNVVLSAVKSTQDNTDDLIVRFYEASGVATITPIHIKDLTEAWASDLKEERGDPVTFLDQTIPLEFQPFEIKTIRVNRRG
jgi:alpha-mannosidase